MTVLVPPGPGIAVSILLQAGAVRQVLLERRTAPGLSYTLEGSGDDVAKAAVEQWLQGYCSGAAEPLPALHWQGIAPFTRAVLQLLLTIPRGEVLSYGAVAARLGKPRAARAVGQACGANPFALFVPCHRVVAAGGQLGGFSQGMAPVKRALLSFEGVVL